MLSIQLQQETPPTTMALSVTTQTETATASEFLLFSLRPSFLQGNFEMQCLQRYKRKEMLHPTVLYPLSCTVQRIMSIFYIFLLQRSQRKIITLDVPPGRPVIHSQLDLIWLIGSAGADQPEGQLLIYGRLCRASFSCRTKQPARSQQHQDQHSLCGCWSLHQVFCLAWQVRIISSAFNQPALSSTSGHTPLHCMGKLFTSTAASD